MHAAFHSRTPAPIPPKSLERRLWDLASDLATNRMRARGTSRTLQIAETCDEANAAPSAERQAMERDRLQRLSDCVEKASSRVFLYFTLRFKDGLTPEEIVDATGWSKKATYKMKQRLNEAVAACAKILGGSGAD